MAPVANVTINDDRTYTLRIDCQNCPDFWLEVLIDRLPTHPDDEPEGYIDPRYVDDNAHL